MVRRGWGRKGSEDGSYRSSDSISGEWCGCRANIRGKKGIGDERWKGKETQGKGEKVMNAKYKKKKGGEQQKHRGQVA